MKNLYKLNMVTNFLRTSFNFSIITMFVSITCLSLNCQESAESHYKKGLNYLNSERYDDAIKEFKEVLKIDPKHVDAFYNLGWTQYLLGRYEEALNNLKNCISLEPNSYKGYKGVAIINAKKGYYGLAIENYKKAISLAPEDPALYDNIADAYFQIGNYDAAVLNAKKAVELNDIGDHYLILGKACLWKENYNEAIDVFEKALSHEFHDKRFKHYILSYFAVTLAIRGQHKLALEKIKEAIQLSPDKTQYKQIHDAIKNKISKKWLLDLIW